MVEMLVALDRALFELINRGCSNAVFDAAMPFVTSFHCWIPVFAAGLVWLLVRGGVQGRWCVVLLIISVAVADLLTNRALKPLVARERPCRELSVVVQRIPCAEGPSFPSSHAVNMATVAVVLSSMYRRWWWVWWSAAVLVGFSRVYVGVHYPGDVLAGIAVGAAVGTAAVRVFRYLKNQAPPRK